MNKLCISKLLQVIEQDLIPTERSSGGPSRLNKPATQPMSQPITQPAAASIGGSVGGHTATRRIRNTARSAAVNRSSIGLRLLIAP